MTYLEEYYEEIQKGNIIVGQEMLTELQQLLMDKENEKYIYDTTESDFRIAFIEKFVKLTKSPFYGKPMKLLLYYKAFIEVLYSFKIRETGKDRFKKAILLEARKNAKSEVCSALSFTELMVGNDGSDIVLSSNDDRQANILYDSVDIMRSLFDKKNKRTHKNLINIKNKRSGSKIFKLSEKTRAKEGLNIDFAIIDEVHEMKTSTIINSIDQSQSIKENPKRIIITTEGFINDGALDEELKYARRVLNGEIEDDTLLMFLYTQDSEQEIWQDESSWQKSNPSLGIIKTYDYLRDRLNKSKYDKAERMFTMCKDFNIKQSNSQAWLMLEDYDYYKTFNIEDFKDSVCIGAVDLSQTTDLSCAKIMMMKPNDNTKYIYTKYFIPEAKLTNSDDKNAGADYKEWVKAGLVDVTPGNDIDIERVADWFYSLLKKYNIRVYKCGYDQKFAKTFINKMDVYGIDVEMIVQNKLVLSSPMKLTEADLKAKIINYNNNPVDKWCLGNSSVQIDNFGNIMCVKINNQASKRIDGAVTLIMLEEMYRRYRSDLTQIWN